MPASDGQRRGTAATLANRQRSRICVVRRGDGVRVAPGAVDAKSRDAECNLRPFIDRRLLLVLQPF